MADTIGGRGAIAEKDTTTTSAPVAALKPQSKDGPSLLIKASGLLLLLYTIFSISRDIPAALTNLYTRYPLFSDRPADGSVPEKGEDVGVTWAPTQMNGIPNDVREFWMGRAVSAVVTQLDTKCPWGAFGSVVVNHSDTTGPMGDYGKEICIGANGVDTYGNPTLHGEISNIQNCSHVLSQKPYNLSPSEILAAWPSFSLYTTGEPCPMCASSIRWSGFKECIFATSIDDLLAMGWMQIDIRSKEVFTRSWPLRNGMTGLLGGVLKDTTDPLFSWQFNEDTECPGGCVRGGDDNGCVKS